jgi:crotonobetainyl-CoA:carnitine CoA-transferase CaiB-like acyl-CoA transferase
VLSLARRPGAVTPTTPSLEAPPAFGPLAGLKVVDSGRFVAGPWAATYLAEFGAEVVHIEGPPFAPPYSDPTRSLPPLVPEGEPRARQVSESWVQYSRNKLSLAVDLKRPEGAELFRELLAVADVWIESSRPGTYPALGFEDDELRRANPRLIIVHVSGYGQTGDPERLRAPSYDLIAQAYSGFLSLQGEPEPAPPMRAGTALNDTVTGLAAAAATLLACAARERSGRGQVIDVAQYEVFFTLLENLALDYFLRGVVRGRAGNGHPRLHPYDLYRARDGWIVLAAPTPESWDRLKGLIGPTEPAWDDMRYRTEHRAEVNERIAAWISARSVEELEAIGRRTDTAISRVYDISRLAEDPHYRARGMFVRWDDPVAGPVQGAGIAPRLSDTPGRVWRGAPWLGQDNESVLTRWLGYDAARIRNLYERGALGREPPPPGPTAPPPFFLREAP